MHYLASALITLFANILKNPQDQQARTDLRLMETVAEFLRGVLEQDRVDGFEEGPANRMLVLCGVFQRIATAVLDKAEKEGLDERKRKPDDASSAVRVEQQQQQQQQQQQRRQTELPEAASTMGLGGGAMNEMPANMDTDSQVRMIL